MKSSASASRAAPLKPPFEMEVALTEGKSAILWFVGAEPELLDVDLLDSFMGVVRRVVEERVKLRAAGHQESRPA